LQVIISELLSENNFEVTIAATATAAEKCLGEKEFDLITLDLTLPDISGGDWIKKIRNKSNFQTPIVVISESNIDNANDLMGVLGKGAQDFIEKRVLNQNPKVAISRLKAITNYKTNPVADVYAAVPLQPSTSAMPAKKENARILFVDDDEGVQMVVKEILESAGFQIIIKKSGQEALADLDLSKYFMIISDYKMPGLNGLEFFKKIKALGCDLPFIMITGYANSQEAETCFSAGVSDVIDKPFSSRRLIAMCEGFHQGVTPNHAAGVIKNNIQSLTPDVIVAGASTGGVEALTNLLNRIGPDCPPVVVVQHIAENFASAFSEHLATKAGLKPGDMVPGAPLERGHLYVAAGDYHIGVSGNKMNLKLKISESSPRMGHRPSVDYVFETLASLNGVSFSAIILSGMGKDGAQGLKMASRIPGSMTFAQSELSCGIFGMPKEAIKLDAAQFIGSTEDIRDEINKSLRLLGAA
jgi:two-component system chemotaxis response regulator CheB